MNRRERQELIRRVVAARPVATQRELAIWLGRHGVRVDQATLSRDIREIGLVKVPAGAGNGGRPRYVEAPSLVAPPRVPPRPGRFVRGIEPAGNLIVVRTEPGMAAPVALAIDHLGWRSVAGTVAGDDTLLVVVRNGHSARRVAAQLGREVLA